MKPRPKLAYLIALVGFLGLFALIMLWHTVLNPNPKPPVALMLILTVTPMLIPMRGFLAGQLKSSAWLAYISLAYFVHGCLEAYANPIMRTYALLETLFSLMVFFGVTLYIRLAKSAAKNDRTIAHRL